MANLNDILSLLAAAPSEAAKHELTAAKAALLGIVEGITEFLPISSTGHLVVTEKLIDVGTHPGAKDAADTYAITIQSGAILAVVVLYWRRLMEMARGVVGRDPEGRRIAIATFIAFIPAAIVGVVLEKAIRDQLFGVWPIIVAWAVGGVVILLFARALHERGEQSGAPLESITVRAAVIIGAAQVIALWPGTSRSMVTILAALVVGYSVGAAVEFSFLLGLAHARRRDRVRPVAPRQGAVRHVRVPEPVDRIRVRVRLGRDRDPLDGDATCAATASRSSGGTD